MGKAAVWGNTAGYATGAAIGSFASQGVGKSIGAVDDFSWKQVAVEAVGGAVTGGVMDAAGLAPGGVGVANGAKLNSTLTVGKGSAATLNATGRAIAGVGNVLASSATNKLLNEPSGFSWANVAASAVGSALGSPIVGESGSGDFFIDVGNSILGAAAGYATKKIVNNEGSWNNQNVLVDAFGNAIGNSIVAGLREKPIVGGGDKRGHSGSGNTSTMQGGTNSNGANDLTYENSLDKWNRFNATGELENLSSAEYHELALKANATEDFYFGTRTPDTIPFSMTTAGMQLAQRGVASANRYRQNAQVLSERVSDISSQIAATAGQNTVRDAGYLAKYNNIGSDLLVSPTTPGPWRDGYILPEFELSGMHKDISTLNSNYNAVGLAGEFLKGSGLGFGISEVSQLNKGYVYIDFTNGGYANYVSTTKEWLNVGNVDGLSNFKSFESILDNPYLKLAGHASNVIGPALSGMESYSYSKYVDKHRDYLESNDLATLQTMERVEDSLETKFVVDSGFALSTFVPGVGPLVAGSYGVIDYAVQSAPSYVPTHGSWSGIEVDGWRGLSSRIFDNQVLKSEYGLLNGIPNLQPKF